MKFFNDKQLITTVFAISLFNNVSANGFTEVLGQIKSLINNSEAPKINSNNSPQSNKVFLSDDPESNDSQFAGLFNQSTFDALNLSQDAIDKANAAAMSDYPDNNAYPAITTTTTTTITDSDQYPITTPTTSYDVITSEISTASTSASDDGNNGNTTPTSTSESTNGFTSPTSTSTSSDPGASSEVTTSPTATTDNGNGESTSPVSTSDSTSEATSPTSTSTSSAVNSTSDITTITVATSSDTGNSAQTTSTSTSTSISTSAATTTTSNAPSSSTATTATSSSIYPGPTGSIGYPSIHKPSGLLGAVFEVTGVIFKFLWKFKSAIWDFSYKYIITPILSWFKNKSQYPLY